MKNPLFRPIVIGLLLGLILLGCKQDTAKLSEGEEGFKRLPDIALPDINGKQISLGQLKGRVVLLNFWATWCQPCAMEIPEFIQLEQELGPRGLSIVGISLDKDGIESIKDFSRKKNINYTILYGGVRGQEAVSKVGGIRGIPTSFLYDRQGRLIGSFAGLASKEAWAKEIEKLL